MSWNLEPHPAFPGVEGPVVVCVLDGVGLGRRDDSDAVWLARTPNLDFLASRAPSATLAAHGRAVGMPSDADMGNSEVGHNAMGAGRIFDQGAKLVGAALRSGAAFRGDVWRELVARVGESGEAVHFIGLLSDGNVHSHIDHLFTLLRRCDAEGVRQVRVHALLDGRDVPETSALDYVDALEELLETIRRSADRDYRIASGGGRMRVSMDRYEADWSMVELGWKTHVHALGRRFPSARRAIETLRAESPGTVDQNLPAFVIAEDAGGPVGPIRDGAAVVLFNFRGDRAIQLSQAFESASFSAFDRGPRPEALFAGIMQYDGDLQVPERYLVEPPAIDRTLGEYLVHNGETQLAISETQKYGHVTYFWNGNRSGHFDPASETYVEIPSDSWPFEQRPWMKAAEITDRLLEELATGAHRHVRVNYANGDMVGHTGRREAAVLAVQCVDLQLGRLLPEVERLGGALLVTADHGNADEMFEHDRRTGEAQLGPDGRPRAKTSHTLNPVPLHLWAPQSGLEIDPRVARPGLANVAATLLHLLGYRAPEDYASSLLRAAEPPE